MKTTSKRGSVTYFEWLRDHAHKVRFQPGANGTDTSSVRLESSTTTGRIRVVGRSSEIAVGWLGWLGCVRRRALTPSVLIRLAFS